MQITFNKLCMLATAFLFLSGSVLAAMPSQPVNAPEPAKNLDTTTGFMQEITEDRPHTGPTRSGLEVYEYRCKGCHGRNTQGAPMPDDKYEWGLRMNKGFTLLMDHALNGYKDFLMPPKGGCRNCNEEEVKNAVIYMIESSGNQVSLKDKKFKPVNKDSQKTK